MLQKTRPSAAELTFKRSILLSPGDQPFGKVIGCAEGKIVKRTEVNHFIAGQLADTFEFTGWQDYVNTRPQLGGEYMLLSGLWKTSVRGGETIGTTDEGGPARANAFVEFRGEPSIASVDFDVKTLDEVAGLATRGMPTIDTPADFHRVLMEIAPELAGIAMLIYASSSGGLVLPGGAKAPGTPNFRADIAVSSGEIIPDLLKFLHTRCFARQIAAQAFISAAKHGPAVILHRSICDQALCNPAQPDFAAPDLRDGVTQDRMWFSTGTDALAEVPTTTAAEREAEAATRRSLTEELQLGANAQSAANFERIVARKVAAGKSREQAETDTSRRFGKGELFDDDVIWRADGSEVLAGVIRREAKKGMRPLALPDPDRGPDYGRTTASVLWTRKFAKPVIHSHAGGGRTYRFVGTDRPLPPTTGRGPLWQQMARGLDGTDPAARDAMLSEAVRGGAGLADVASHVPASDWDTQWRRWARHTVARQPKRCSWLPGITTEVGAVQINFDDNPTGGQLMRIEMGLGKTFAAIKRTGHLLREAAGPGDEGQDPLLPIRKGGRKTGAVYVFCPTIELGRESYKTAQNSEGYRPYQIRGKSQPTPETEHLEAKQQKFMCPKTAIQSVTATSREDTGASMCGPRSNRCSAYDTCRYQAQPREILEQRSNMIFLTHAGLWNESVGAERLPWPVALIVDEEPILGSALTTTRRFWGSLFAIGLSPTDLRRSAELVNERVTRTAENRCKTLKRRIAKERGEVCAANAENLKRAQKDIREGKAAEVRLRNVARWLQAKTEKQRLTLQDVAEWVNEDGHELVGVLRKAIRPTVQPSDWERTPAIDLAAETEHILRQTEDFFARVLGPFIRSAPALDACAPAGTVVIMQQKCDDGRVIEYPAIQFAWVAKLLKRWRGIPAYLLDGTGSIEIYRTIWPDLRADPYRGGKWAGKAFWIVGVNFGKTNISTPKGALTARGESVATLIEFIERFTPGRTSVIGHKGSSNVTRNATVEYAHHGNIKGINRMRGVRSHIVIGKQSANLTAVQMGTEAVFQTAVEWVDNWQLQDATCGNNEVALQRHPDQRVNLFVEQISSAGQAQAAHRARPVREAVDVFILGPEADWIGSSATPQIIEWQELKPRVIDRMIAEQGIAFGGGSARELFPWLSGRSVRRIHSEIEESTWLIEWAESRGFRVIRGFARPVGSDPKIKGTRFLAVLRGGEELDLSLWKLEETGRRVGVRQKR